MKITTERQHNGSLLLSTIVEDFYIKHVYYDFTVKEAKEHFREYVKEYLADYIPAA